MYAGVCLSVHVSVRPSAQPSIFPSILLLPTHPPMCYLSILLSTCHLLPGSSLDKESACSAGDLGSIPGWGRSPGEGNGNPLQYSGLEDPLDRGGWRATIHGVARAGHDLVTKEKERKTDPTPSRSSNRFRQSVFPTQVSVYVSVYIIASQYHAETVTDLSVSARASLYLSLYLRVCICMLIYVSICDHVYVSMCICACISLPVIASHYHPSGNRDTFVGLTPRLSLPPPALSLSPSPAVKG